MSVRPRHHEWYQGSPFAAYQLAHRVAGSAAHMLELAQPPGDFSDPPTSDLVLVQAISNGIDQTSNLGGGRFSGRSRAGALFLIPPETATEIVVRNDHVIRCLGVSAAYLRPQIEEARPNRHPFDFGHLDAGAFQNAFVSSAADRLWDDARADSPGGRLLADGLIVAITGELLRASEARTPSVKGGLAQWQIRRATEYLAENLHRDVSLAELSELARLSPNHFCRAFRASIGVSPSRYLIERRIERTKQLMRDPAKPLIEVALEVGYESQGAFGTAFRRVTGTPPAAWRRERLS